MPRAFLSNTKSTINKSLFINNYNIKVKFSKYKA